jgi:hypothetical protein
VRELVFRRIHVAMVAAQRADLSEAAIGLAADGARPAAIASNAEEFNPCVVSLTPLVAASVRTFVSLLVAILDVVAAPSASAAAGEAHLRMVVAALAPSLAQLQTFELRDERGALPATIANSCRAFIGWCERRLARERGDGAAGDDSCDATLRDMMLKLSLATGSLALLLRTAKCFARTRRRAADADNAAAAAIVAQVNKLTALRFSETHGPNASPLAPTALRVGDRVEARAALSAHAPSTTTPNGTFPPIGGAWLPAVVAAVYPDASVVVRWAHGGRGSLSRFSSSSAASMLPRESRVARSEVRAAPASVTAPLYVGDRLEYDRPMFHRFNSLADLPDVPGATHARAWVRACTVILASTALSKESAPPPGLRMTAALFAALLSRAYAEGGTPTARTAARGGAREAPAQEEALLVELRCETFVLLIDFLDAALRGNPFEEGSDVPAALKLRCAIASAAMRILSFNIAALRASGLTPDAIGLPTLLEREGGGTTPMADDDAALPPLARLRDLVLDVLAPQRSTARELPLLAHAPRGEAPPPGAVSSDEQLELRRCAADLLLHGFDTILGEGSAKARSLNAIIRANARTASGVLDMLASGSVFISFVCSILLFTHLFFSCSRAARAFRRASVSRPSRCLRAPRRSRRCACRRTSPSSARSWR